jgi:hypothetical protein
MDGSKTGKYNFYEIQTTELPFCNRLSINIYEIMSFNVSDIEKYSTFLKKSSPWGDVCVQDIPVKFSLSKYNIVVYPPNFIESWLGITFEEKLDKAHNKLRKIINNLHNKQTKMMDIRRNK